MRRCLLIGLLVLHALYAWSFTARMIRWSFVSRYASKDFQSFYKRQKAVLGPLSLWWIAPQIPLQDISRLSDIDDRAEKYSLKKRLPYYHPTMNAYDYLDKGLKK